MNSSVARWCCCFTVCTSYYYQLHESHFIHRFYSSSLTFIMQAYRWGCYVVHSLVSISVYEYMKVNHFLLVCGGYSHLSFKMNYHDSFEAFVHDDVWSSVFSKWNESLPDRRFVMDVDHVLTLHHSQVSAWTSMTYQTWKQTQISPLYGK